MNLTQCPQNLGRAQVRAYMCAPRRGIARMYVIRSSCAPTHPHHEKVSDGCLLGTECLCLRTVMLSASFWGLWAHLEFLKI